MSARFVVREIEGYVTPTSSGSAALSLSCSVIDRAWNYAEVARFNEEDEPRQDERKRYASREWKRARLRARAQTLAASLEASHRQALGSAGATPPPGGASRRGSG